MLTLVLKMRLGHDPARFDSTASSESSAGWIVVVSGPPRSGTSLMMNMLQAGGLPILSDGVRAADSDNPMGYFELEAVKRLPHDSSWLGDAVGKAVKVQAFLLPSLPAGFEVRAIFMQRDPHEIVASQDRMLRQGRAQTPRLEGDALSLTRRHLQETERWLSEESGIRAVRVDYARLVADPLGDCHRINAFLGGGLDVPAMMKVIDPSLYRQRGPRPVWMGPPSVGRV